MPILPDLLYLSLDQQDDSHQVDCNHSLDRRERFDRWSRGAEQRLVVTTGHLWCGGGRSNMKTVVDIMIVSAHYLDFW